ncbi:hypothetical protein LXA43DRAFT_742621 [Ganoderma leucocontextum]|nr:hypothetical protein LXA43DRAFT_742621 [Ganoderma leucocontextum]
MPGSFLPRLRERADACFVCCILMLAGAILTSPDEVLNPESLVQEGSANIFTAKTLERLECHCGLVGRVLIWSSWSVGVEVMRSGVTIGNRWIFFTYKGGDQRSCDATRTEVFRVREDLPNLDYILGILSNWVVDATDPFEYFGKAAKTPDIEM